MATGQREHAPFDPDQPRRFQQSDANPRAIIEAHSRAEEIAFAKQKSQAEEPPSPAAVHIARHL